MFLSVMAKDHMSEKFYLQKGNDMGIITLDSSRVKASGALFFNWVGEPDLYRLSDESGHIVDFRMEKSEMNFEIKGDFSETELIFESGNKNNQLQYYISEFDYYNNEAERINSEFQSAKKNNVDTKDIESTYKEKQKEFEGLVKDLWSKRSEDWSLQVALSFANMMPDLDQNIKNRVFIDRYFEYFDFTDSLLVGSPSFYNKFDGFFKTSQIQNILKRNVTKEIDLMIQHIFWLSEVNPYAHECLVNYLMDSYPEDKKSSLYNTVVKTYSLANSCEYVLAGKNLRTRVENDKNFLAGNKSPDFILQNCLDMSLESFSKVNSEMTLLVAWSAHCENSVDLLIKIQGLYDEYHDKGLEVVAMSIDNNLGHWNKCVNENGFDWINACDKKGLKGEFATAYNIISTPSLFVISPDLKLIAKPITFFQLKKEISSYLD